MSYTRHAFHYVVEGGVTYMCMAEKNEKQRIPFKFLKDIKSKFQCVQPPPHSLLATHRRLTSRSLFAIAQILL